MTTIEQWIHEASAALKAIGIPSYRLDAEILLATTLGSKRPFLHAHGQTQLTTTQLAEANHRLKERLQRVPIAYILGRKEFYGRDFIVSPDTLIPRPETETLVASVLSLPLQPHGSVLDVGTGCGAIAVTLKLENPTLEVYATDVSLDALKVARQNATRLQAEVYLAESDLLEQTPIKDPTCIVANLPYVDQNWERSPETNHEPPLALFAERQGLALIQKLITQACKLQLSGGYVALEADPTQHGDIVGYANAAGYRELGREDYALILQRA